jgi:MoaA/NifB/PqqE/SkfB family radical SAM enzyme
MKLEDIGFYTLSDARAASASEFSPLSRCELILTDKCNFKCPYCRGLKNQYSGDMDFDKAANVVKQWTLHGLKNIRFSGGEPTFYEYLPDLVLIARKTCEHIALSTNGTAPLETYEGLIKCGVNDFSISLDACCASTADLMSGGEAQFEEICNTILELSDKAYVTVGVVLTPDNISEVGDIIDLAHFLQVNDIRIIPSAQWKQSLDSFKINKEILERYPILEYRYNNLKNGISVRGLSESDNHRCPLVLDDMAVVGDDHYPCIIYLREQGEPIGKFTNISEVRAARARWYETHNVYADPICRMNCLDVCRDYSNRWKELHS